MSNGDDKKTGILDKIDPSKIDLGTSSTDTSILGRVNPNAINITLPSYFLHDE